MVPGPAMLCRGFWLSSQQMVGAVENPLKTCLWLTQPCAVLFFVLFSWRVFGGERRFPLSLVPGALPCEALENRCSGNCLSFPGGMRPQDGAGGEMFELSPCPAGPCQGHSGSFGVAEDGEQRRASFNLPPGFPFPAGKGARARHSQQRSSSRRKENRFGRKNCCWLVPRRTGERGSPGIREIRR